MQAEQDVIDVETRVIPDGIDLDQINLIQIINPFDPRDHSRSLVPYRQDMTVAGVMDSHLAGSTDLVVSVNGKIIEVQEWELVRLERGDSVVVCPMIEGGGGGKKILSVVAMLAVSVFAPPLAAAMAGSLGLGAFGTAMLTAGLTLAGSYLVHSIFAPSRPTAENRSLSSVTAESSPTYGIDGAKNTSIEGIVMPVCYGRFRMAGNIVSLHTDNVGETQDLYVLLAAGEGPVQGISDIRLNNNPYTDYPGVEVQLRLGDNQQGVLPWFNNTVIPHNLNTKLAGDGSWTPYTTNDEVDRIRVDLVAPQGIYYVDKNTGETGEWHVPLEVQYAPAGSNTWSVIPRADGGASEIRASKRAAVRTSFDTGRLPTMKYDVRVRRATYKSDNQYVTDEVYVSDINEIVMDPLTYPNTALVALKIRLGDQISGMPEITFLNHGRMISVWNGTSWSQTNSSNPAWVCWDILTNSLYGAGMASSRLDLASFKRWADHCASEGLTWNGPIDTEMNVWDATQYVLRVGRAQLVNIGTRWSVVVEKAQTPSMMFSVANMVKGSYKEQWLPMSDRANEVDVTYFDKDDDYKRHTLKVYDPMALAAGQAQKTASITLYGVVDYQRAFKEGMFQLNLNRFILKTVSFQAPMEAVACSVGDLVYVQHDMPHWADSGRVAAGSTSGHLMLDRPVTIEAGKSYLALVKHDRLLRASGTVTGLAGTVVTLSSWNGIQPVKRLGQFGRDYEVVDSGAGYVTLTSTAGLVVGQPFTLYDTDVIEERHVLYATTGEKTELELASNFSSAPEQFSLWMFGETTKVKQIFRIKSISGAAQDGVRDIAAIQYDPQIYDYGRFGAQFSTGGTIDLSKAPIGHVRGLTVYEETYIAGSQITSQVVASWQPPITGQYFGADVYISYNGGQYQRWQIHNRTSISLPAARGQRVRVKVQAYDIFFNRAPYVSAPEVDYVVQGELTGIDVGSVSAPDVVWSGRDCRLTWRYNSRTHSYEFGSEPVNVGADAGSMDPHFKDYEIRVWHESDPAGAAPRRVEYTTENGYVYTYEKNYNDGLSRRLRFEIRMRDIFNNLGAPASITASNLPPRITSLKTNANFEAAQVFVECADTDYAGLMLWVAEDPAQISGDINSAAMAKWLAFDGADKVGYVTNLMPAMQYYLRAAAYDVFGKTELVPSNVIPFATTYMDIKAIQDGILSESLLIPSLQERINLIDGPADLKGSVANLIKHEEELRQAGDNEVMAQVTDVVGSKLGDVQAAIAEEKATRASADSALAQSVNTVTSTVNGQTATIQTQAVSIDGLKAQYTVKIDNNGYVSGFGLASTAVNGVPSSEFIVRADKFAIAMPGVGGATPFVVGNVNGIPRVVITSALIGDATINSAKIADGAITTLKIGNQIYSSNYDGNTGWILEKNGNAWFLGQVVLDRCDIRRRPVLESGVIDSAGIITGTYPANSYDAKTGSTYTTPTPIAVGTCVTIQLGEVAITGLNDANYGNLTNNQPYRCQCFFDPGAAVRNYSGSSICDFNLGIFAEVVRVAAFSNRGNFPYDGRLMIRFSAVLQLVAGSFNQFRLPPFRWAVYKI